nr:hypothetical protein Itr_chr10CG17490 [Ipomoea trifida]
MSVNGMEINRHGSDMETDGGNVVRKKQKLVAKSIKKMMGIKDVVVRLIRINQKLSNEVEVMSACNPRGWKARYVFRVIISGWEIEGRAKHEWECLGGADNVEGGIERGVHNVGLIELVFRCEHGESRGNVALREDDPLIVLKETALLTLNVGLLNLLKRLVFSRSRVPSVGDCVPRDVCVVERHEIVDHPLSILWNTRSRKIEGRQAWAWIDRWNSNNSSISSSSLWLHKLLSKPYWLDFIHVGLLNLLKRLAFSRSRAPSVGDFVPRDVYVAERHEIVDHPLPVFWNTESRKIEGRRGWIQGVKLLSQGFLLVNNGKPSSTFLGCHLVLQALGLHYKHPNLGDIGGYMLDNSDEDTNLPRLFEIVWLLATKAGERLSPKETVSEGDRNAASTLTASSQAWRPEGPASRAIAIKLRLILPPLSQIVRRPAHGLPFLRDNPIHKPLSITDLHHLQHVLQYPIMSH